MNVYLCNPNRSAIGRYAGGLANIRPDDLLAQVIRAVLAQCPQLPTESIDDAFFGCANQAGEDNRNVARMATLLAGVPFSVPATTINRLCGSGMDAIGLAYRSIASGEADLILAGGVESMSRAPFVMGKAQNGFDRSQILEDTTMGWRFINPALKQQYGTETMPETAENVAAKFSIGREAQDNFAYQSQLKAATAQASGRFAKEITPVTFQPRKGDAIVGEACSPTTTYAPQMFMLTQNPFVAPPVQKPRGPGHAQKPHEHHKEKCGHACTVDSDCGGECKCRKGDGSLHHTCKVPTTDTKKPKPDGRPDDQDPKHNCCHGDGECGYSWCAPKQKCVQKFLDGACGGSV